MRSLVGIDCLPESVSRYRENYAVVAIDVIRATTTAVTAALTGRRCFAVSSTEAAFRLAQEFDAPLLAGELGGEMPEGFELNNSPAAIASRTDISRPMILLSSSGTRLIEAASQCQALFLACLRNHSATAHYLIQSGFRNIALIGAGTKGEFREEDQMCCAWIAAALLQAGYLPKDDQTLEITQRWWRAAPHEMLSSKSVSYLRRTRQLVDLDFILQRIDDVDTVVMAKNGEIFLAPPSWQRTAA